MTNRNAGVCMIIFRPGGQVNCSVCEFTILFKLYQFDLAYLHEKKHIGLSAFKGLFAVADFHKKLNGHLIILPDYPKKGLVILLKIFNLWILKKKSSFTRETAFTLVLEK